MIDNLDPNTVRIRQIDWHLNPVETRLSEAMRYSAIGTSLHAQIMTKNLT